MIAIGARSSFRELGEMNPHHRRSIGHVRIDSSFSSDYGLNRTSSQRIVSASWRHVGLPIRKIRCCPLSMRTCTACLRLSSSPAAETPCLAEPKICIAPICGLVSIHASHSSTLPHAFWYDPSLPESIEATHIMADFMLKQVAK
jgi:hypothetical protein